MSGTTGITVSELNLIIAEAIRKEPRIRNVTVRGEVSGFRCQLASGHWYFSLKDENSTVSCVMFRQNTFHTRLKPKDGDSVIISGYIDVYPKNGVYQLYTMNLMPDGTGSLYLRFEELKRRLDAEGLFDPGRKRVLPQLPRKVAVRRAQPVGAGCPDSDSSAGRKGGNGDCSSCTRSLYADGRGRADHCPRRRVAGRSLVFQ